MTNEELKVKMLEFIASNSNAPEDGFELWQTPREEVSYVLLQFAKFLGIDESGLEVE